MTTKHDVYTALLARGVYLAKCRCGAEATGLTEQDAIEAVAHDTIMEVKVA